MDEVSSSKYSAAGISKEGAHLLGYCWLNHCFCFQCKIRLCLDSGHPNNLLPCASVFNLFSFNVFCSAVLRVLFSSFCLYESKLKASCGFGDTAEKLACRRCWLCFLVFVFKKENITDFVFVLLLNRHQS